MDYAFKLRDWLLALAHRRCASGAPVVRRGCVGKAAGWRARCAPVRCQYRDVLSANPAAASRSRKAGCLETAPPGCVSFGYLSLHKQRKVTRSAARTSGSSALEAHLRSPLASTHKTPQRNPRGDAPQSHRAKRASGPGSSANCGSSRASVRAFRRICPDGAGRRG